MSGIDQEVLHGFVQEVTGYLPAIRAGVAALRAAPDASTDLEETHRCVHTIKGAAAMVGLPELSHIAFHLEEIVESLMNEPGGSSPELLDGIEASVAHIEEYLAGVASGLMEQPVLAAAANRHVRQFRGLPLDEIAAPINRTAPEKHPEATELLPGTRVPNGLAPDLAPQLELGDEAPRSNAPLAVLEWGLASKGPAPSAEYAEATETLPDIELPSAPAPVLAAQPEFGAETAARPIETPEAPETKPASTDAASTAERPEAVGPLNLERSEIGEEAPRSNEAPEPKLVFIGDASLGQPEVTEPVPATGTTDLSMPDLARSTFGEEAAGLTDPPVALEPKLTANDALPAEHAEAAEAWPDLERFEFGKEATGLSDPPAALEPRSVPQDDDSPAAHSEAGGALPDAEWPRFPMPDLARFVSGEGATDLPDLSAGLEPKSVDDVPPTEHTEATETLSDIGMPDIPMPDLTQWPEFGEEAAARPDDSHAAPERLSPSNDGGSTAERTGSVDELADLGPFKFGEEAGDLTDPPAILERVPALQSDALLEQPEVTETLPGTEPPDFPMPDLTRFAFGEEAAGITDPPAAFASQFAPQDGDPPTAGSEEALSDTGMPGIPMPDLTQWSAFGEEAAHLNEPLEVSEPKLVSQDDGSLAARSEHTEALPDTETPDFPMPDLAPFTFGEEAAGFTDAPAALGSPFVSQDDDPPAAHAEAAETLSDAELPSFPMPDLARWPEFDEEAAAHLGDPPAMFGPRSSTQQEDLADPDDAFGPVPLPESDAAFASVFGTDGGGDFDPEAISELVAPSELEGEQPTEAGDGTIPPELLEVFRLEADDHIRVLTTLLPQVRTDPTNRDHWQLIRRAAHTLKGTAGLVGFDDVTRLSHRMEDLLDLYFEGTRTATGDEIDALLAAADVIAESVEHRSNRAAFAAAHARLEAFLGIQAGAAESAEATDEVAAEAVAEPVAATAQVAAKELAPAREAAEEFVRVPIKKLDEIAKLVGELVIARTALEQRVVGFARLLGEAHPAADRLTRVSGKLDKGYEASALARGMVGAFHGGSGGGSGDGFDALELDRYTEIHLLSRELAETAADVRTMFSELGQLHGEFTGQLLRQVRLAGEVEDKLMQLRMVPLSTITAKLQRAVRTAATSVGKKAELVIDGDRTGLDKTMLEALADPLLHLVRNAVDHGLEPPEVRLALGKDAHGALTLRARHEGSHVVLTLADDGRGIDFEKVRGAVVRRGLASPEHADAMSDEELADFLFRPGFSTREAVSELSGRGVGLDVVRSKVESIKGSVSVASRPGNGTTFTIRLPMTLAVVRALVVRAAGQTFAIPLEAVEQILRPSEVEADQIGRNPVLRLAGSVCPLLSLAHVLRLPDPDELDEARQSVVVLGAGGRRVALRVDQLIGGSEVVIKALGRHLRHMPAVAGATLLGDGSVVLILNPAELARISSAPRPAAPRPAAPRRRDRDGHSALVVDDSPSIRRVLSLLLTGAGWRVTTAKDGLEALELLQRGDAPDVVLTDVEMPRMDGYELLASVRSQASLAHLPVAVLTSRAADKHRRKALDLGASAYVVKPYQDENLLEILGHLVRPRDPRDT